MYSNEDEATADHKRMQLAIENLEGVSPFNHVIAAPSPVWLGDVDGIPLQYSQVYDGGRTRFVDSMTFEIKLDDISCIEPRDTAVIWSIQVVKKFADIGDLSTIQAGVHILPPSSFNMTAYRDLLLRINIEQMQDHAAQGIVYKDNIIRMVSDFLDGKAECTTPSEYVVRIRGYGVNKRVQSLK